MTGDAHPFAAQISPRVRESPIMIKGLTFVKTLGVVDSSNHGRVSIQEDPLVTICHEAGSVGEVFIVIRKLGLRHEGTVVVRTDEGIGHQSVRCVRIVIWLSRAYIALVKRRNGFRKNGPSTRSWLDGKFRPAFRGYPVATVAFYGPNDKLATKVAVSVILTSRAPLHRGDRRYYRLPARGGHGLPRWSFLPAVSLLGRT